MPDLPVASRRNFLTLAGAGIAAAGAAVAVPRLASGPAATPVVDAVKALPANIESSITAFVSNVHDGIVTVMVGGREAQIVDHALVSKLAHAVAGSKL